jgi:REP element-mobilizing transposase RayT
MPVRFQHDQLPNSVYYITFTCYKWKHLFSISQAYDAVYKWFDKLYEKKISVFSYVIMPNHLHVILHFPSIPKSLNSIIGNAKRFMAYEIIKGLEKNKEFLLLEGLQSAVSKRERTKGQRHKVFEESFDAKECQSMKFILEKIIYIHHNPVRKRWQLVSDFTEYEHSSASFYEKGIKKYKRVVHLNDVLQQF